MPVVPGYEFSCVVREVGSAVEPERVRDAESDQIKVQVEPWPTGLRYLASDRPLVGPLSESPTVELADVRHRQFVDQLHLGGL